MRWQRGKPKWAWTFTLFRFEKSVNGNNNLRNGEWRRLIVSGEIKSLEEDKSKKHERGEIGMTEDEDTIYREYFLIANFR